jgi:acyl-coenzyme A thioesterase 13
MTVDVPAGFKPLHRTSPFNTLVGPLYTKGEGAGRMIGLRAETKHCNSRGIVHGGLLATLADLALGYTIAFLSDPPRSAVTASLTIDYAGSAKVGDWLEVRTDVQKSGGRLTFANCYVHVGEARIVRASAVFAGSGERRADT